MRAHTFTQNKGVTVHYCKVVGIQHCDTVDNTVVANNEFLSSG